MGSNKAMKHWKTIRKCQNKQRPYFWFCFFLNGTPSVWSNPALAWRLNIRNGFPDKNDGDAEKRTYAHDCIRSEIATARNRANDSD